MSRRKKICFVVAVPGTARTFLSSHIENLSKKYDIYIAGNFEENKELNILGVKDIFNFPIHREISISKDLMSVFRLASYFRRMKFDAVHSVTPKAGLVTALAARIAGVKNRIHIFTGQVWATRSGMFRKLLKFLDKTTATLDNHILVDGESQRKFIINEGIVSVKKSRVLGAGSICGANIERFTPSLKVKDEEREKLGISKDKVVFSFMGRLNKEKGFFELLNAFNNLSKIYSNIFLLVFGLDEEGCLDQLNNYRYIQDGKNFKYCGRTPAPQISLQASDVFCLPSYREGFGMSVVEAQALEIPVICSDAYGLGDTIADNETGLRCKVQDVKTLQDAMDTLYNNPELRTKMGKAGRERVANLFSGEKIVGAWGEFYDSILG